MTTVPDFINLVTVRGSSARYFRSESLVPCPCRTPEGFRDPEWHAEHPLSPVCNDDGMLPDPSNEVDAIVKAFVQPIQSTRATRLSEEFLTQMFGTIQADDHLGIFPESWNGQVLDFNDWPQSGASFIEYNGQKFLVVNANLIPDPSDGNPRHHWELGLRLIS